MKKTFCDVCDREGEVWQFDVPVQFADSGAVAGDVGRYVSENYFSYDLCDSCRRSVYAVAMRVIRGENG